MGTAVVYALMQAGIPVTALVPPDGTLRISTNDDRVQVIQGDVWNRGSLKGRSRGHHTVIHLVGSIKQQPARGLTYHYLNVDSVQNITRMAIGDGVQQLIFLSAAGAPWLPADYIQSKREAEQYIQRSGIRWTILRAPLAYPRSTLRNPLLIMISLMGAIPLIGRPFARWAPLPVDVMARGIAQLALSDEGISRVLYGRHLRRLSREFAANRAAAHAYPAQSRQPGPPTPRAIPRLADTDDDAPFGWLP